MVGAPTLKARRLSRFIAGGLLLAYAIILRHLCPAASGSDASGYLNHARALASGHVHVPSTSGPIFEAAALEHRPVYAAVFPREQEEVLTKRLPGPWVQVGTTKDVAVWQWKGGPGLSG